MDMPKIIADHYHHYTKNWPEPFKNLIFHISKLESKIAAQDQKLDFLVDITKLHEQHFKASFF
jgi:hypothetical protein